MKYLILRRLSQFSIIFLYFGANAWGWKILQGNLSSSKIFETIPMSDPYAILQIFFAGSVVAVDALIGGLVALAFYVIIGGRAFCSWVCPINIVTETASYVRGKLNIQKYQEGRVIITRNSRYYILVTSLVLSSIFGVAAFEFLSPISIVTRGLIFGLGVGVATLVLIFLFDLFVLKDGWCGHFCPLGGFYSLIGRFSLIRVKHNAETCTACMKCKEVCPEKDVLFMVSKESLSVNMGECTLCGRCIDVCGDNSMKFHIRDYLKKESK
ncbi:MAG: quinol dehydrogenase ferredoxin subunit NapH [Campylobacterales bacterium]|nr:quinol dehydrogenase ferredoxin subunit NapH [Campylobacterales bacterium]